MFKFNAKKSLSIMLSTFLASSQVYIEGVNTFKALAAENGQVASNVNVATTTTSSAIAVPAFPGAEGYGAYTVGGRGGDIYHVTNLNSTGLGSFYEGMTTGSGPRTIVFDVSGYIKVPHVTTNRSNLTIEGQTAPGEGVCIITDSILFQNANNIIVRYLRFRRPQQSSRCDSLDFNSSKNIIVDHCSFSGGNDEVLSIQDCQNVTVQWSIVAESPRPHSMGGLIQGNTITMHHNLYAHNNDRNPKAKGIIDFVNNVVYNWGDYPFVAGGDSGAISKGNVVGNYFIAGKDSKNPQYAITRGNANYNLFLSKNYIDSDRDGTLNGKDTGVDMIQKDTPCTLVDERFAYPLVNTESALDAYNHTIDKVGASINRDSVDKRIIGTVTNQTGKILDLSGELEVGGFTPLASGTLKIDTDNDGIPDEWENANGLNPNDASDASKITTDGYTNLEHYLNSVAVAGFPNNTPPPTLSPAPVIVPSGPLTEFKFDFGSVNSPVEDGYTGISDTTVYDSKKGYGWDSISNVKAVDQGLPDSLREDYCCIKKGKGPIVFKVDLPNGDYTVKIISGDYKASQTTNVSIEGDNSIAIKSDASEYTEKIIPVTLNDGQMNISFSDSVHVCAIEILPNPKVPTGFAASKISSDNVELNWGVVDGADSYNIYRALASSEDYKKIGSSATTEFTDYTVTADTTYKYKISSAKEYSESDLSDAITVTTKKLAIPSQPQGLTVGKIRSLSVELSWDILTSAQSYNIYRTVAGQELYTKVGNATTNSFADKTTTPNTTYYYKITAVNSFGESDYSDAVSVTTVENPGLVTVPTGISTEVATASAIKVSWNAVNGKEGYNVYRKEENAKDYVKIGTLAAESYLDTATKPNVAYSYAISAYNELGESDKSAPVTIKRGLISYKFDFGTDLIDKSPIAAGYTGINQNTAYSTDLGYGWDNVNAVASRSRHGKADATKKMSDPKYPLAVDFCLGVNSEFKVDVANGYYNVKIMSGDLTDPNVSSVSFEGEESQQLNAPKGSYKELNYVVKVADGQLTVDMGGNGRINALEINEIDRNSYFSTALIKTMSFQDGNGKEVTKLTSEGTLDVNTQIINSADSTLPATMIVALYDANNTLIAKASDSKQLAGGETQKFDAQLNLPKDVSGCYVKVFVWDNLDNMTPLTKPVMFNK